jgi:uncharacterized membrane protein
MLEGAFGRAIRFFPSPLLVLFGGVAASTITKLSTLNARELWLDETRSAFFATLPLRDLFRYSLGDTAPPLYHALLWIWVRLVGSTQAELRLMSVLLSVLGILCMLFAARAWLGTRWDSAFAALLLAFSPTLYVYSLEVRQYMLALCCVTAILIIHKKVAGESLVTKGNLLVYCLLATLLFYSHYVGLFILSGLMVDWLVACRLQTKRLLAFCAAAVVVFLATSPWFAIMFRQRDLTLSVYTAQSASISDPTSLAFGSPILRTPLREEFLTVAQNVAAAAGVFPTGRGALLVILAVPLVAVLAGIAALVIRGDRTCRMVAWALLLPSLGLFGLGMSATRYLVPLVPLIILAMCRVLQCWMENKRWRAAALVTGSLLLLIYIAGFVRHASVRYPKPWHSLVAAVQPAYRQGDILLFDVLYGQVPFDYAAQQVGFKPREDGFPETIYHWWERQPVKIWGGPVLREADLESTIQRAIATSTTNTVWLILSDISYYDPRDLLLARFKERGDAVEVYEQSSKATATLPVDKGLRLVRIAIRR